MVKVFGKAIIKHSKTGQIREIEGNHLVFQFMGLSDPYERSMGVEKIYSAFLGNPPLEDIEWTLWEYPDNVVNLCEPKSPYKLIKDNLRFDFFDGAKDKFDDLFDWHLAPKSEDDDKRAEYNSDLEDKRKFIRDGLNTIQNATPLAESVEWNSSNQKIHITPVPANNIVLWEGDLERLHDEISDIKSNDRLSNTHTALIPEIERLESRLEQYKNSPQRIHDEIDMTLSSVKWLEDKGEIANDIHTQRLKKVLTDCALDIKGDVPKVQEAFEKRKTLRLRQLSEDEQKSLSSIAEDVIPYIEEERIKQDMQEDIEALKKNQNAADSQEETFKTYRLISRLSNMLPLVMKHVSDFIRNVNEIIEALKSIFKALGL